MGQIYSIRTIGKKILISILRGYQVIISPLFGARCRFYPSCSNYAIQALEYYSLIKGICLICKRILKCHPLHQGGEDPIPLNKQKEIK